MLRAKLRSRLALADEGAEPTPLDAGVPSGVTSAVGASPSAPRPVFRRKRSGLSEPSPPCKKVCKEGVKSEERSFSSPGGMAVEEWDDGDNCLEPKRCCGCFRVSGVDRSYCQPGVEFRWLYDDGKGDWCKDCNAAHRIYYARSMTLSLFGRWLKTLKTNRVEFFGVLLAIVSIKNEGTKHISKAAVDNRRAVEKKRASVKSGSAKEWGGQ